MKKTKKKETKGYPLEPPPIVFDACFARKEPKFLVELRTFQELSEQKKKRKEKKNREVRYLCWGSRELARPSS